jgi:hypothetical protein
VKVLLLQGHEPIAPTQGIDSHAGANGPSEQHGPDFTDREDFGRALRAPFVDESGANRWRYTLRKFARTHNHTMTLLRTRVIPAIVMTLVAAVALLVFRREPEASWLRVDAPSVIVVGEPFIATVTLLEPADGAFLDVDLHGKDARKSSLRVVAAGQTQAVAGGQRTFRFALVLRERPDVALVHAVIYLSRSGQWSDAFRVARSDSLGVIRGTPGAAAIVVRPLTVHDQKEDPAIEVADSPFLRAAIAALWLGAGGVAAAASRRSAPATAAGVFIVLCVVLAVWEAFAAGTWITEQARTLARAAGLYEERRIVQQVTTVALACVFGLLAAFGLRRSRRQLPGLALAGMALYAGASLADMLSLHEVDRVLATKIGAWSLAGLLRLAGACAAAAGAVRLAHKGYKTNRNGHELVDR